MFLHRGKRKRRNVKMPVHLTSPPFHPPPTFYGRARAKAHWENQPSLPLSPPLPLPPPPNSHENQSVLVLWYVARSIHSLFPKIKTRNIPLNNFFDINRIKSSYHRDDIFKKTSFIQNKYIYIYSYCILLRDTKVTIFNWYRVIEEKIHG